MSLLYVNFTHKMLDAAAKFLFKISVADFAVKSKAGQVKFGQPCI